MTPRILSHAGGLALALITSAIGCDFPSLRPDRAVVDGIALVLADDGS
ncbi:MAG: hypothetical protein ACREJB_01995 [Planctomycetaceae bacterium]